MDNVHPSVKEDDLSFFVAGLSVKVVSCFPVKPRRRRDETGPITDRKAFRLCIPAEDRARLLDDTKWPESIVISEWYHVNPADRRQISDEPSVHGEGTVALAISGGGDHVDDHTDHTDVSDATVIIMDQSLVADHGV